MKVQALLKKADFPSLTLTIDAKIKKGFNELDGRYLQMNGLGLVEIESVRDFYGGAFDRLRELQ